MLHTGKKKQACKHAHLFNERNGLLSRVVLMNLCYLFYLVSSLLVCLFPTKRFLSLKFQALYSLGDIFIRASR